MPTHYHGTPEEIRALEHLDQAHAGSRLVRARLADHGTCSDVTPSQFGVLEALHHLGPLRQGEISAKLLRSGGNITLVVDNLEARGLVQRTREPNDRRVVTVAADRSRRGADRRAFPAARPCDLSKK